MELAKTLQDYLKKAGIEPAAAQVYIELAKTGPASALQLAKTTGVSRTQVYRFLETLQANGLVGAERLSYGTLFRAQPLENIEGVIADREAQTAALRSDLAGMVTVLQHLAGSHGPKATIQHFYGVAGLKQANWNLTKAQKEYRVFEAAHLNQHLDAAFTRRHRERIMQKELTSYDLTNATEVTHEELDPINVARAHVCHIDPKILTINFEVYIYNDTVTLLDYSKDNAMALEIHHPTLQTMMRQLFDAMWRLGQPLEIQ